MSLEVVTFRVSDVHQPRSFCESLGWRLDADIKVGDAFRAVQLTPPHSNCSITFGKGGVTTGEPGSLPRLLLAVSDLNVARQDLINRGVDVSEVYHLAGGRLRGPGWAVSVRPVRV